MFLIETASILLSFVCKSYPYKLICLITYLLFHSVQHIRNKTQQDQSPVTDGLSPWEEWFLCKEKELRARLQTQALEVNTSHSHTY